MKKYKRGTVINGVVSGITDYGIFVKIDDFYNGLIHISEVSYGYVRDIRDFVDVGDNIYAEVMQVDENEKKLYTGLQVKYCYLMIEKIRQIKINKFERELEEMIRDCERSGSYEQ